MALTNVIPGSKVPFNIEVTDIHGGKNLSATDVDVKATFYVMNKMDKGSVVVIKSAMTKVDDNTYTALVDTTDLPAGTIMATVEVSTKDGGVKWIMNTSTGFALSAVK